MIVLSLLSTQRKRRAIALVVLLAGLLVPAAAQASGSAVIKDCTTNGRLTKSYSQSDYASALANLPTDVDEYTDCRDVIKQAQLGNAGGSSSGGNGGSSSGGGGTSSGGSGGGSGSGSGGGSSASSPQNATQALQGASKDEAAAVAAARAAGAEAPSVATGTGTARPVDLSKSEITSLGSIPTPLLVALALLALASLSGGGSAVYNRVRARRSPA